MSEIELAWYASSIIGNKLYIAAELFKKIYEIDLNTKMTKSLEDIDCYMYFKEMHAIRDAFTYKDYVYFIGMYGTGFFKYGVKNKTCSGKIVDRSSYMADYVREDEDNIIVSTIKPWEKVWRLNLDIGEYHLVKTDCSDIKEISVNSNNSTHYSVICENKVYYPIVASEYVAVLNLVHDKFECIKIAGYKLFGVVRYQDEIIFSIYGSYDLIKYNTNTHSITIIKINNEKAINEDEVAYSKMHIADDKLLLLPSNKVDKIMIYNFENSSFQEIDYPVGFQLNKKDKYLYSFYEVNRYKDKLIISQLSSNMMLFLDINTLELSGVRVVDDNPQERIREISYHNDIIQESNEINLETFINTI